MRHVCDAKCSRAAVRGTLGTGLRRTISTAITRTRAAARTTVARTTVGAAIARARAAVGRTLTPRLRRTVCATIAGRDVVILEHD
jgi:hypothetical protein